MATNDASMQDRDAVCAARLLVSDIDDTLVGDDAALARLLTIVDGNAQLYLALNSSRPLASVQGTLAAIATRVRAIDHDATIGAMGTEVELRGERDAAWEQRLAGWKRAPIDAVMSRLGYPAHSPEFQTPYKASFAVPAAERDRVIGELRNVGVEARFIHSGVSDFDVIPSPAGKKEAMTYVAERLGVSPDCLIVAGDSANDLEMFQAAPRGIVVGNAREELRRAVDPERVCFARCRYAAGIIEGLIYWGVIDQAERRVR